MTGLPLAAVAMSRTHATGSATVAAAAAQTYTFTGNVRFARVSNYYSSPTILRIVFNTTLAGAAASATYCDEELVPGQSIALQGDVYCANVSVFAVGAEATYETHFSVTGWR